jgi:hypothetical protein
MKKQDDAYDRRVDISSISAFSTVRINEIHDDVDES